MANSQQGNQGTENMYCKASMEAVLESLSATNALNYFSGLNNTNKPLNPKPPICLNNNKWAKTRQVKGNIFGAHLAKVFTSNEADSHTDDSDIDYILNQPFQVGLPLMLPQMK